MGNQKHKQKYTSNVKQKLTFLFHFLSKRNLLTNLTVCIVIIEGAKSNGRKDAGKIEEKYGRYCFMDCLMSHKT